MLQWTLKRKGRDKKKKIKKKDELIEKFVFISVSLSFDVCTLLLRHCRNRSYRNGWYRVMFDFVMIRPQNNVSSLLLHPRFQWYYYPCDYYHRRQKEEMKRKQQQQFCRNDSNEDDDDVVFTDNNGGTIRVGFRDDTIYDIK